MATPNDCLGTLEILLSEDKVESQYRKGARKAKPKDSPPIVRITSTESAPVTVGLKRASHVYTSTNGPMKLTLDKYPGNDFHARSHADPNFEIASLCPDELNLKVEADSGGVVLFDTLPGTKFSVQIEESGVVFEFGGNVLFEGISFTRDLSIKPYAPVNGLCTARTLRPCKISFYAPYAATVEVVRADAPPKSSQNEMPLSSDNPPKPDWSEFEIISKPTQSA